MDPKYIKKTSPPTGEARRAYRAKELAQALVMLLDGREKINRALSYLPNRTNRDALDHSLREGITNLLDDIRNQEGL